MAAAHQIEYNLQFCKNANDIKSVNFTVRLTVCEIDSLTFLFSKYFDQSKHVHVKGLTFFNEFNKCVDAVKANFDAQQDENVGDGNAANIKQLFSMFLKHEFMAQVPNFKKIIQFLQKYLHPIKTPSIKEIAEKCDRCPVNQLDCLFCKMNYLAVSISTFDAGIQHGWDIFLRPMFGLPLFLYVLMKTDYDRAGVFTPNDLMTNSFVSFFYNLLDDKSSSFVNHRAVQPLVNECRRVTTGFDQHQYEFLLSLLRNKNTCETPFFAPFKSFVMQLAIKTKIKQSKINKIAAVVFTGFYLRVYIESVGGRLGAWPSKCYAFSSPPLDAGDTKNDGRATILTPFELELRNVCRFILPKYDDVQFENFIVKLANIKRDLSVNQYIVTEKHIRSLINKYKLDEDFSILLNQNV
nr:P48 [Calliteara abietis nucleopolyhedrovirus]